MSLYGLGSMVIFLTVYNFYCVFYFVIMILFVFLTWIAEINIINKIKIIIWENFTRGKDNLLRNCIKWFFDPENSVAINAYKRRIRHLIEMCINIMHLTTNCMSIIVLPIILAFPMFTI